MKVNFLCNKKTRLLLVIAFFILFICEYFLSASPVYAENPFYGFGVENLAVRASFYTIYSRSTEERKNNIRLAARAINKSFINAGAEFSFNNIVGKRTEKRGYKKAKIIVGGKFEDGVGGGVCQVSTTLYNAVLLSGLKITEYHPHTLPVGYVAPSFDAMVNSGNADLKFVNTTRYPIIIAAEADGEKLTVSVWGVPQKEVYVRKSVFIESVEAPKEEEILDENGEYPELYEGESKVVSFSKNGYKSEGYLIKTLNGKQTEIKRIRKDCYAAQRGVIIKGTTPRPDDTDGFFYFDFIKKLQNKYT